MLRVKKIIITISIGLFLSSSNVNAVEPGAPEDLIGRLDAVGIRIHDALTAKFKSETKYKRIDHGSLLEFYNERNHQPVWVDQNGLTQKAKNLISEIKNADKYGLNTADYSLPSGHTLSTFEGVPADWLSKAEIKLSYAALAYARHARGGRTEPKRLSKYIDVKLNLPDPTKVMNDLAKTDNPGKYLASLHPQHQQFKLLMVALDKERSGKVEEQIIIPDGPTLRLGNESEDVTLLRKRLDVQPPRQFEGLTEDLVNPNIYDEELEQAVRDFQKSNGLKADGIVGRQTRRVLNGGQPADREKTIIANMERWRWLPTELSTFHIKANIPEFKFNVISKGKSIHSERIITGKITNQTPIFSDQMETVVFNPYWYPPKSIIRNEILPGARRNENFISRHRFQITNARGRNINPYNVDWYSVRPNDLSFRQPPGPRNVLGELKFLFPNKHAVYMHDTPTKHLFKKETRAYSHGCVRVQNPRRLAEIILANENWSTSKVNRGINRGSNQHIRLKNKVPVHITYFTAWVDPATGELKFFNDIYKHDKRVTAKLEGRPVPPDPVDPVAKRVRQQENALRSRRYDSYEDEGFFGRRLFRSGSYRREESRRDYDDDADFNPFFNF